MQFLAGNRRLCLHAANPIGLFSGAVFQPETLSDANRSPKWLLSQILPGNNLNETNLFDFHVPARSNCRILCIAART